MKRLNRFLCRFFGHKPALYLVEGIVHKHCARCGVELHFHYEHSMFED